MAVRKHVDKKWFYDFYITDVHGTKKRVRKYGYNTKKEAQEAERTKIVEYNESNSTLTFKDVLDQFISYNEKRVKLITLKKYNVLSKLYTPFFDNLIDNISVKDISKWQKSLIQRDLSISYINTATTTLSSIFKFSIKYNDTKKNPATIVGGLKDNEVSKIDFFSLEEYRKFDGAINDDLIYKTLFNVLYYLGLRKGEALALQWSDIDFDNSKINIYKTLSPKMKGRKLFTTSPKTKSSIRTVSIPKDTLIRLQELKKHYSQFPAFNSSRYVFGFTEPLGTTHIDRKRDKYCKAAGVKKIRIHDFRHSHASLLIKNGANAIIVAKRLGHSDIEMTLNTYSHLFSEKEDEIINLIDNL